MYMPDWDTPSIHTCNPLDVVLSDDIWNKFELEEPLPVSSHFNYERTYEENMVIEQFGKARCIDYQEIRHHDCMWAGLCISKEHSRTMPTKKDNQIHRKVAAGRSLLISRATASSSQQQQQHNKQKQHCRTDSLESDGDSIRSETPHALSESDSESDCEVPMFKHDQICINDKFSEWVTTATRAVPVSEVTGQFVRSNHLRNQNNTTDNSSTNSKSTDDHANVSVNADKENEIRNTTMSDHCYHINQAGVARLTEMGVQTPSDSEEEIDVVSFEKPCRPVALPTHPNPVDHQTIQLTVNTALKEKPAPRPRGRPPSNANRKRAAQEIQKPAKRMATQRTCQKKTKATKNTQSALSSAVSASAPIPTFIKSVPSIKTCFDEEPDNDKRNLHNNMERQRRIELRHAFDDLRRLVPEIEAKEKAPKVAILQQAAEYCERLKQIYDENLLVEAAESKRQKKRLAKIHILRVALAQMRQEKLFADNLRNCGVTN